jgi:hypothetical protein
MEFVGESLRAALEALAAAAPCWLSPLVSANVVPKWSDAEACWKSSALIKLGENSSSAAISSSGGTGDLTECNRVCAP